MKFQLLLILALLFTFSFEANAINTVAVDADGTTLSVTGEKITVFKKVGNWFKKQKSKAMAYIVKKAMAIDWEDERTILKYWIIALIAAALLWITAIVLAVAIGGIVPTLIFYLSYFLGLAGTVLFWYWIYLKFIK